MRAHHDEVAAQLAGCLQDLGMGDTLAHVHADIPGVAEAASDELLRLGLRLRAQLRGPLHAITRVAVDLVEGRGVDDRHHVDLGPELASQLRRHHRRCFRPGRTIGRDEESLDGFHACRLT